MRQNTKKNFKHNWRSRQAAAYEEYLASARSYDVKTVSKEIRSEETPCGIELKTPGIVVQPILTQLSR